MNELVSAADHELAVVEDVPPDSNPGLVYLAGLGAGSVRAQRGALQRVSMLAAGASLEAFPWHRLRYQHVVAIKAKIAGAPATVNRILAALRGVVRESWRLGYIDAEQLRRVEDIKGVKGSSLPRGRALSIAEVQKLGEAADTTTAGGARDRAMLAVLFGCGLRRAELAALSMEDYAPTTGELRVTGKGSKERIAYVTPSARAVLNKWLGHRGKASGALFCAVTKSGTVVHGHLSEQAIYGALARLAKAAGVAAFSPHDLRRTFISELLDRGADLSSVRDLAGHSNVSTTTRYDRRGERARRKSAELLAVPF